MHVIWHGKGLALCSSGGCSELTSLHAVIEAKLTHIQERRQDAIDAVMEEVVELPFSEHGEAHKGNLHLVFLQGDIVSVEIAAVVHVLGVRVHDGIVTRGINLVLKHLRGRFKSVKDRTQDLGCAPQGIVGLDLLLKDFLLVSAIVELNLTL